MVIRYLGIHECPVSLGADTYVSMHEHLRYICIQKVSVGKDFCKPGHSKNIPNPGGSIIPRSHRRRHKMYWKRAEQLRASGTVACLGQCQGVGQVVNRIILLGHFATFETAQNTKAALMLARASH